MSLNWEKLISQGRAKAPNVPWTDEEHQAILALMNERGLHRMSAANFVLNGVVTLEAYDKAKEAEFKPKSLKEVTDEAVAAVKDNGATFGATKTGKSKKKI